MKFYEAFRYMATFFGHKDEDVMERAKWPRKRVAALLRGDVEADHEIESARYLFLAMGYPIDQLEKLTGPNS